MHLFFYWVFRFRLGLCTPSLSVLNVRCTVPQSPAPGRYKDTTDLERGIDFVASITCCCSMQIPAGMAFIFHAGSDYGQRGCHRTLHIPSLTLQAGRRWRIFHCCCIWRIPLSPPTLPLPLQEDFHPLNFFFSVGRTKSLSAFSGWWSNLTARRWCLFLFKEAGSPGLASCIVDSADLACCSCWVSSVFSVLRWIIFVLPSIICLSSFCLAGLSVQVEHQAQRPPG